MTQETMTKEQILEILNNVYRNHMTPGIATGIIHQQLSAERERAGKLVEAAKYVLLFAERDGWIVNSYRSKECVLELQQTINDYDTATKES